MDIVLASGSPRRRELLTKANITFRVSVSEVDETLTDEERQDPANAAQILASRKAGAVASTLIEQNDLKEELTCIIGSDTMVVLNGVIFGKPHSKSEAVGMLRKLAGQTHEVMTGVSIWLVQKNDKGEITVGRKSFTDIAQVTFKPLNEAAIQEYVATGDPYDKAGAYAIQGPTEKLIAGYEGDIDTIIGLPVAALLKEFPDLKQR